MLNALTDNAGVAPLDGAQVDDITRLVRGDGILTRRRSLFDACARAGANCTRLLPWSECIERTLRGDCLATRSENGEQVTARCDVLDAWNACARLAPDTGVIDPGDPGFDVTLPEQTLPKRGHAATVVALLGVAAGGVAVWKAMR